MGSLSLSLALCSLAACAPLQAPGVASPAAPHRVVFVCEHGSVKSLVATQYFNRRAQERGLAYRAFARGTTPDVSVPNTVREGLLADGFDVSAFHPRQIKASDLSHASIIVSFDQGLAKDVGTEVRYLHWDDLPGILSDYGRGRDEILRHVDELINELASRNTP